MKVRGCLRAWLERGYSPVRAAVRDEIQGRFVKFSERTFPTYCWRKKELFSFCLLELIYTLKSILNKSLDTLKI